jgi:predicted secreted protein
MILKQYYLGCLAHASYLIADEAAGEAAVVDPQRDVEQYVEDARSLGCRIGHVVLTHLHADFLAGHLELRDREGATVYLGVRASAEYAFTPLADHDMLEVGRVRLEVLETPGHSPESISILVEKNPNILAASFMIPAGTDPSIGTRVKMGQTSNVYAVVKADGKFYTAGKEIKVTLGGCGG